jgi:cell fate regulator YaaT (PSP1 superfamily)
MNDLFTQPRLVAAVRFKWQKGEDTKTYDYFVPAGLELAVGDRVVVETKRGETEVEVVEIKTESDKAEKTIIRRADPAPVASETPAAAPNEMDF